MARYYTRKDESHDGLTLSDYAMGQTLSRTMVVLPSRELRQTLTRQEVVGVRETPELEYPFDRVAPTHLCDQCGAIAKVNMHMDQGEIIDFFYECKCGNIIEGEDA